MVAALGAFLPFKRESSPNDSPKEWLKTRIN